MEVKKMAIALHWGIVLLGVAAEGQQGLLTCLSAGSEWTWAEQKGSMHLDTHSSAKPSVTQKQKHSIREVGKAL